MKVEPRPGALSKEVDDFFSGHPESRAIFDAVQAAVQAIGPAQVRVTKSQVSFRRERGFAWAWMPDVYLEGGHAPLVLTLALRRRDASPRWKQVVEPYPGRFTHHLELRAPSEVDAQARRWLQEAWEHAA
ncbi:MAG TPA: DUF5655 domain-containing protein [Longimicrobium sp.]|nr:DUF5655 domain-containing protein [Longimicrobium sp.]